MASGSVRCRVVNCVSVAASYRDNGDDQNAVIHHVNQPVADCPELDLVMVRRQGQLVFRNSWCLQSFSDLFLELGTHRAVQTLPFFEGVWTERKRIRQRTQRVARSESLTLMLPVFSRSLLVRKSWKSSTMSMMRSYSAAGRA